MQCEESEMENSIWIGFDSREAVAYAVAAHSIRSRLLTPIPIFPLILPKLQKYDVFVRPITKKDGKLYDEISNAPMATEFALTRFLVPSLVKEFKREPVKPPLRHKNRWALFMDCDMLVRCNLANLFRYCTDDSKAVMVVKHDHVPKTLIKMDGQIQTSYPRKNWSSFCLFNVDHPANNNLTVEMVNTARGLDLHKFCWLDDSEIGELGVEWNYLVGHSEHKDPAVVHYTDGVPTMPGYENCEYSKEWFEELHEWAASF
jgi:hypothetical protein